jgi:predicted aconitase with swiveling domain
MPLGWVSVDGRDCRYADQEEKGTNAYDRVKVFFKMRGSTSVSGVPIQLASS